MKKLFMFVAAALAVANASAQINPMEPIPMDKEVRTGQLENGLTYYIRHNEKPKGQADFYILHDVGAIQEEDNQQGLAHFLEHMAFNGTKNLPGKTLIEYLEKVGVKFGTNLNANTSWDRTMYLMRDVPTSRQGIIDTAMLVLHDWSHFIALEPAEIDSERGVIMEELRTSDNASWRSTMDLIKALGRGTRYEHRNLIGYLDGLKNFEHDDLVSFYQKWYRPDLQAVAIVGDIDVDKTEEALKKLMSDIPAPAPDAAQKEVIIVADNEEPIVTVFTDPEMSTSEISLFFKRQALPKQARNLVVYDMQLIMMNYICQMENARLAEIAQQPDAPFLSAYCGDGGIGIIPTLEATTFSVKTEDGKLLAGLEALYTEIEKMRRYGFTDSEFERAQNNIMRSTERQYTNRNDRKNGEYVSRLLRNYQFGDAAPDAEYEWKLDSTIIKMVTLNDLNTIAMQIITPNNLVVDVTAPEKGGGIVNPTAEQVIETIARVKASEVKAYEDNVVKEPLIANPQVLKGSPIKKSEHNKVLDATVWTLANGATVIVKPTTFKADEVRLSVSADGGNSILSDEEFYASTMFPGVKMESGLSKFSAIDLRKQLSGKSASIYTTLGHTSHGMSGFGSPKDIETLLQLLYLNFTSPRFNEDDFNTCIKKTRAQIENMHTNPDFIAQKEMLNTVFDGNYRAQVLSPELLDGIRFEQMRQIHQKLYSNAADFTFTFVGNIDPETLKPLVERYIGSLPGTKPGLAWTDDKVYPIKGMHTNDFRTAMLQPKVKVMYCFTGEMPYTIENRMKMTFLTQALSSRYLISIREEKGGTYGVAVQGQSSFAPKEDYMMLIVFDTNEQMADELMTIVDAELQKIADEGPLTEDVEKTREYLAKSWKNGLEENASWMDYIDKWYTNGLDYISNYENVLKSITNEDIQAFAKQILADGNLTKIIMRPEAAEKSETAE